MPQQPMTLRHRGSHDIEPVTDPRVESKHSDHRPGNAPSRGCGANTPTFNFSALKENSVHGHLADNEAIHTGYRAGLNLRGALMSLFAVHNETWNVWSHLLGAVVFIGLIIHLAVGGLNREVLRAGMRQLPASLQNVEHLLVDETQKAVQQASVLLNETIGVVAAHMPKIDEGHAVDSAGSGVSVQPPVDVPLWPIAVFMVSAVICMSLSTAFHLLHVVSKRWFEILARADYAGIAVLIAGSNVPPLIYGFWCAPYWRTMYLAMHCISCGTCVVVGMLDRFQTPPWRLRRMSIFLAAGLFGGVPLVHMLLLGSHDQQQHEAVSGVFVGLASMGAQYIIGALLYGFRIPESLFPGKFDLAFASHGIFHVLVFSAAFTHYRTVVSHYSWRTEHPMCDA